jgi:hypothetical protein
MTDARLISEALERLFERAARAERVRFLAVCESWIGRFQDLEARLIEDIIARAALDKDVRK